MSLLNKSGHFGVNTGLFYLQIRLFYILWTWSNKTAETTYMCGCLFYIQIGLFYIYLVSFTHELGFFPCVGLFWHHTDW